MKNLCIVWLVMLLVLMGGCKDAVSGNNSAFQTTLEIANQSGYILNKVVFNGIHFETGENRDNNLLIGASSVQDVLPDEVGYVYFTRWPSSDNLELRTRDIVIVEKNQRTYVSIDDYTVVVEIANPANSDYLCDIVKKNRQIGVDLGNNIVGISEGQSFF